MQFNLYTFCISLNAHFINFGLIIIIGESRKINGTEYFKIIQRIFGKGIGFEERLLNSKKKTVLKWKNRKEKSKEQGREREREKVFMKMEMKTT